MMSYRTATGPGRELGARYVMIHVGPYSWQPWAYFASRGAVLTALRTWKRAYAARHVFEARKCAGFIPVPGWK